MYFLIIQNVNLKIECPVGQDDLFRCGKLDGTDDPFDPKCLTKDDICDTKEDCPDGIDEEQNCPGTFN